MKGLRRQAAFNIFLNYQKIFLKDKLYLFHAIIFDFLTVAGWSLVNVVFKNFKNSTTSKEILLKLKKVN